MLKHSNLLLSQRACMLFRKPHCRESDGSEAHGFWEKSTVECFVKLWHDVTHSKCIVCGEEFGVFELNHDPADLVQMCIGCATELKAESA